MARLKGPPKIKRGEIWVVDLKPGTGWEIAKKRPALVISNNSINSISPLVIIIPISSQIPKVFGPERIIISKSQANLDKDSIAMLTQIRAIDKSRLIKKIGIVRQGTLLEVEDALQLVLGITKLD